MATVSWNVLQLSSQEYAFALRTIHRLCYEHAALLSLAVVDGLVGLVREDPRLRREVELV